MESFNQNVIKHKAGLLNLAAELGDISKACRIMGFSRDTFAAPKIALGFNVSTNRTVAPGDRNRKFDFVFPPCWRVMSFAQNVNLSPTLNSLA
jgi:hypothetical protein